MRHAYVFTTGIVLSLTVLYGSFLAYTNPVRAQENVSSEVNRIRNEINERNNRLRQIETEIAQYQSELQKVGAEKSTLKSAINALELERKKVQSDLSYTQNKIGTTDLEIERLNLEITATNESITRNQNAIKETLRRIDEADDVSLIETLLTHANLSDFWVTLDALAQVRSVMEDEVRDLAELNAILAGKMAENRAKRGELVELTNIYAGQQKVLEVNKSEKNQLLVQTQNEEKQYQTLLAEREAAKAKFEQELKELEAKLKFTLDPTSIPSAGSGVFAWPLDNVRITQTFGYTQFAQSAAYNGQGHNGIDLGAPTGSTVRAALSGTVIAINTQVAPMCQYGKWVLIKHANGLTTLYAHLSVVSVNEGESVVTGQVIGHSGATGYATGPHLHFTVYASGAVNFTQYTCNSGITLTVPVSAASGYLNPMNYLPAP